jgi:hypothetical protein
MGDIAPCVVHLVRAGNDIEPFAAFLKSYHAHPAGIPHELVVVFKGFRSARDAGPYLGLAGEAVSDCIFVGDEGFDLTAYFAAAIDLQRECYCFLNSYSVILADDWLRVMHTALSQRDVGLVGASGSWASVHSYLRYHLGLRGPYARFLADQPRTRALMAHLAERRADQASPPPKWLVGKLATIREMRDQILFFEPFPCHHVRTNAFMLSGELWSRMQVGELRRKVDAYRLESGRSSITRQVERLGLRAVVTTCDGRSHAVADWPASDAFWQRNQENLLIADNQTRDYERGDAELRGLLSRYAWGERASPA